MRLHHLALLAGLQLCAARQPGFSIHEDLLAHPQFEVVFSDSYILETDAQLLLAAAVRRESSDAAYQSDSAASSTDLTNPAVESAAAGSANADRSTSGGYGFHGSAGDVPDGSAQVSETFEIMNVPPVRYLCTIPVLAPPAALNKTATELARAEEARETSRMASRGTDIISTLEGECMYYVSGWWSYSFCYGKEIVQFHALTSKTGKPVRDLESQEYVLGRMQGHDGAATGNDHTATSAVKGKGDIDVQKPLGGDTSSGNHAKATGGAHRTELQIKGDQRYMVQRLGAGTICDLTGRERTVEIQYHCNPGGTSDRINWIKEVTTCAYLVEVLTPRLCEEAAFLPPKPTRAHPISCRPILRSDEVSDWRTQKTIEEGHIGEQQEMQQQQQAGDGQGQKTSPTGIVVGGVVIGARKALGRGENGQPPLKLEAPKHFGRGATELLKGSRVVKVLARAKSKADGGELTMLSIEELSKFEITRDQIKDLVGQLIEAANGRGWRLEAVEHAGVPTLEIRAIVDVDHDGDNKHGENGNANQQDATTELKKAKAEAGAQAAPEEATDDKPIHTVTEEVTVTVAKAETATDVPGNADGNTEGSEETFKDDEI
ncbi:Protein OS-9 [Sporothrix epigloea]|uniref:Endoplasmic reticulum lectin n=1 Tax=Sporothrix epigloea TaxID=1892477 RepID=A0ABP0D9S2_9PEZI